MIRFLEWIKIHENGFLAPVPTVDPRDTKYGYMDLSKLGSIRDMRNTLCQRFGVEGYAALTGRRYIMDDGSHGSIVKPREDGIYITMTDSLGKFTQKSIQYKRALQSNMRPELS